MKLLWAVAHGLDATSSKMHAELGVTGPQRLVLRLIAHFRLAAPGDLAETLHVHPSSLTGSLRRLEEAGLIRRKRDPRDGRRAILTLTAQGKALNDQRHGTVESAVQRALKTLEPEDVKVARNVLKTLANELGVDVD